MWSNIEKKLDILVAKYTLCGTQQSISLLSAMFLFPRNNGQDSQLCFHYTESLLAFGYCLLGLGSVDVYSNHQSG